MQKTAISYSVVLAMTGVVSACDRTGETRMSTTRMEYLSLEDKLIRDGLVKIFTSVKNVVSDHFATEFAACVVARYALVGGFKFVRLVTHSVSRANDIRTVNSIYNISARLHERLRKINSEVVAVNCAENRIPMV